MERWRSVRIDEVESIPVVGGSLHWRALRRTLDVEAFGINAYVAAQAGEDVVEEHSEQAYGHEEVYVVLSGRATFTLGGEELAAPAGTVVFVRDPAVVRRAIAEEPGTTVLAVGGPRGGSYEPPPWEDVFAAERHRAGGDYGAMVAELEEALHRRPDRPRVLWGLAVAKVLAGRPDEAVADVARVLELRPEWAEHLAADDDLSALHDRPDWPLRPAGPHPSKV